MKFLLTSLLLSLACFGVFLFFKTDNNFIVTSPVFPTEIIPGISGTPVQEQLKENLSGILTEEQMIVSEKLNKTALAKSDIENQKPLANPPSVIKAIYATSWSAGSSSKMDYFIDLAKNRT